VVAIVHKNGILFKLLKEFIVINVLQTVMDLKLGNQVHKN